MLSGVLLFFSLFCMRSSDTGIGTTDENEQNGDIQSAADQNTNRSDENTLRINLHENIMEDWKDFMWFGNMVRARNRLTIHEKSGLYSKDNQKQPITQQRCLKGNRKSSKARERIERVLNGEYTGRASLQQKNTSLIATNARSNTNTHNTNHTAEEAPIDLTTKKNTDQDKILSENIKNPIKRENSDLRRSFVGNRLDFAILCDMYADYIENLTTVAKYDQEQKYWARLSPKITLSQLETKAFDFLFQPNDNTAETRRIIAYTKGCLSFKPEYAYLLTNSLGINANFSIPQFNIQGFCDRILVDTIDIPIKNGVNQITNALITGNDFRHENFFRICNENENFYCVNLRAQNHKLNFELVISELIRSLTNKSTSVMHLFPQNQFLTFYLLCDTNFYLDHAYILSFEYLYFLHLFDTIMQFNFKGFTKTLEREIKTYNCKSRNSRHRKNYNYTHSNSLRAIKTKMNFLYSVKTELQRIYSFLIFPFVSIKVMECYTLMYAHEYLLLCTEYHKNLQNTVNIQKYVSSDFFTDMFPIFYITKLVESLIANKHIEMIATTEELFSQETYLFCCRKSMLSKKSFADKRKYKMFCIFWIYLKSLDTAQQSLTLDDWLRVLEKFNYRDIEKIVAGSKYTTHAKNLDDSIFYVIRRGLSKLYEVGRRRWQN